MAMNHNQQQGFETNDFFRSAILPVYGPPPAPVSKRSAVLQAFRRHPLVSCSCLDSFSFVCKVCGRSMAIGGRNSLSLAL